MGITYKGGQLCCPYRFSSVLRTTCGNEQHVEAPVQSPHMHLQNVKHGRRGCLWIAGLCLLGNEEIELWLFLIGGKVLSSREMDCKFNLEWKLIWVFATSWFMNVDYIQRFWGITTNFDAFIFTGTYLCTDVCANPSSGCGGISMHLIVAEVFSRDRKWWTDHHGDICRPQTHIWFNTIVTKSSLLDNNTFRITAVQHLLNMVVKCITLALLIHVVITM